MIRQFSRLLRNTSKYEYGLQRFYSQTMMINSNRYKLSSPLINYSFSVNNNSFDSVWQSALNKIKDVKSQEVFDQFKQEMETLDNYEMALNYCLFILDVMKQRMEVEKANEVCNIAIEFSKKKNKHLSEPLLVMFQGQKALFDFKLGKLDNAKLSANSALEQFDRVKSILNSEDMIGAVKLLQEVFQTIENYPQAEKYALMYLDLILKDNIKCKEPYYLFQSHSALFDAFYGQGKTESALQHGISAAQNIPKISQKTLAMHYLLIGVSFSYYQLGQSSNSDEYLNQAMEIFKQLPQSKQNIDLEQKKQDYINIRERIKQQQQLQEQAQQQQQQQSQKLQEQTKTQQQSKQNQNNSIWNEDNDKGLQLRDKKEFKEAIAYYSEAMNNLNEEQDIEKIITILDRQALVYFQINDFVSAINNSLKAHEKLMKLRSNQLIGDKLSFQNITNLKTFYFENKQWEQSVEWGKKWHKICEMTNAFESENMEEYMLHQVISLQNLNKCKEAISYSQNIMDYLNKMYPNDHSSAFSIQNLLYQLNYQDQNYPASLESGISAYNHLTKIQEEQQKNKSNDASNDTIKQDSYMLLKNITALALMVRNDQHILKYGAIYLEQQPSFEPQNNISREKQIIEQNIGRISSMNGDFSNAEKYLKKSLQSSKDLKMPKLELSSLISLASILVRQTKVDEAFNYINQAQQLSDKLFEGQSKDNEINLSIARIYCFLYHLQQDYKKCLEWVDKCLLIQKNIPGLSNEQLQPTIDLLKQLKDEVDDQESVLTIANKHNITKLD